MQNFLSNTVHFKYSNFVSLWNCWIWFQWQAYQDVDPLHQAGWDLRCWEFRTAVGRLLCRGDDSVGYTVLNPGMECPSKDWISIVHTGVRYLGIFKTITNLTQRMYFPALASAAHILKKECTSQPQEVICNCFFHCTKQLSLFCVFRD